MLFHLPKKKETPEGLAARLKLAELSARTDFSKCAFDAEGLCAQRRKWRADRPHYVHPPVQASSSCGCCCAGCASASGYFSTAPANISKAKLAKLFDPVLGFYRPKTGCVLPREHRSSTCLSYSCFEVYQDPKKKTDWGISGLAEPYRQLFGESVKAKNQFAA